MGQDVFDFLTFGSRIAFVPREWRRKNHEKIEFLSVEKSPDLQTKGGSGRGAAVQGERGRGAVRGGEAMRGKKEGRGSEGVRDSE